MILVIAALSRAQVQMVGMLMVIWGLVCVVARWGVIGANVFVCAVAGVTGQQRRSRQERDRTTLWRR